MKNILSGLMVLLFVMTAPGTAAAFDKKAHPFGLGIEIGDPTGVTGKYYFSRNIVAQAGVGIFSFPYWSLGGHLDVLYEAPELINTSGEGFTLPLFIGAGLKAGGYSGCRNRYRDRRGVYYCDGYTNVYTGVRVPFGVAMQLRKSPLEVQLELAPAFAFDLGPYYYGVWLEADAALAVRYYF